MTPRAASELPLNAQSSGTMDHNRTGTWKVVEPFYADHTPPCVAKCPAGSDIVRWLGSAAESRPMEALDILREANPFPSVCGRVCPHPCEAACNRAAYGGSVGVHHVERFVGDRGIDERARVRTRGARRERVAVVGAGPAGLACAFYLGRQGFAVTVYESLPFAGGLLRTGIPPYRLPRAVVEGELRVFRDLPVTIETGRRLGQNVTAKELDGFDALFLAVGRQRSKRGGFQGETTPGVEHGLAFLRALELEDRRFDGRVLVVGGGNTAMDCARSALRRGASVTVVYRRTEAEMPAFPEEVEEAREEGVEFVFQAMPTEAIERRGRAAGLRLVRTRQGDAGPDGRRAAVPVEGSGFELPADLTLLAIGEEVDGAPLEGISRNVFRGGDLTGAGTVSAAIGDGRRAAAEIEKLLAGKTDILIDLPAARGARPEVVRPDQINGAYVRPSAPLPGRSADPALRRSDFREVNAGLDGRGPEAEAARCISCGTCSACDNCLIFCPDRAIVREGNRYRILYEYCKGCGVCVQECPRMGMAMRKVTT